MPSEAHFRRDHFPVAAFDREGWKLRLSSGTQHTSIALQQLEQLPSRALAVVLECAGHRRKEFDPPAQGVQWGVGAVSEALWSGARLSDVLACIPHVGTTHVVLEGADSGSVGPDGRHSSFARAIPIEKALHHDTLIALRMNGSPIPHGHGGPLRAIVPGWYATDSVKWLARIVLRTGEFDGYFEAVDYRVPSESGSGSRRMTDLALNAILTSLPDGATIAAGQTTLRGIAWCGNASVSAVDLSIDGGKWRPAEIERPQSPYGRTLWRLGWLADQGAHTIVVRASDSNGVVQPAAPHWNPSGYANASRQRVRIEVR
jgi:DMSO/TMAO reductase YedYZ molybdopterin-dependent catalytic subunit